MIPVPIHRERRIQLTTRIGAPVLFVGNRPTLRNLRMNEHPFRQDSTMLYFTGCDLPNTAALLVENECTVFMPPPDDDDALWMGPLTTLEQVKQVLGVDHVRPLTDLAAMCQHVGVRHTLAVTDPHSTALASRLTGLSLSMPDRIGPDDLVEAVVRQRRLKSMVEVAEIRIVAAITDHIFRAIMGATHAGDHEAALGGLLDGLMAAHQTAPSFTPIVTVDGEVLHNHHRRNVLKDDALLLLDAGFEVPSGYCSDVTRTWPVSGHFDARQRAAYAAVLEAEKSCIALCRPGVRYRDVHMQAAMVIARFLADEGLLRVGPEEAVEAGAHALFFPHGIGHLLGLDVHDLEDFGDRAAYAPGRSRSGQFGLNYLRMDLDLEPGLAFTIEPGFYVVPAILDKPDFRSKFSGMVDFDVADRWRGFGGIRIEDDLVVTTDGCEILTAAIPKEINELEALVGSGPSASARLGFNLRS